jgi:hypothetical protein
VLSEIPELSFNDGKYGFDLVYVEGTQDLVERPGEFSTMDPEHPFPFSVADRFKRASG